jgi:hypothetical protein
MKDYPPSNGTYYADLATVLADPNLLLNLISSHEIYPGRCITFATGEDPTDTVNPTGRKRTLWKTYQYVGPLIHDTEYSEYTNQSYWKELNI